jgi:hypothetical protein
MYRHFESVPDSLSHCLRPKFQQAICAHAVVRMRRSSLPVNLAVIEPFAGK